MPVQTLHNAEMVIGYIDQGGLSLPDRDYYMKDDAKMTEMRNHLIEYATQEFTLAGQSPDQAKDSAQTVLRIETALAKASMDRTLRRDPKSRDHKMSRADAVALAPNFYFNRYFKAMDLANISELNVSNPDFFKQVNAMMETESLGRAENLRLLAPSKQRITMVVEAIRGCEFQDDTSPHRPV
jgi:predicted metalloendopeptidase